MKRTQTKRLQYLRYAINRMQRRKSQLTQAYYTADMKEHMFKKELYNDYNKYITG